MIAAAPPGLQNCTAQCVSFSLTIFVVIRHLLTMPIPLHRQARATVRDIHPLSTFVPCRPTLDRLTVAMMSRITLHLRKRVYRHEIDEDDLSLRLPSSILSHVRFTPWITSDHKSTCTPSRTNADGSVVPPPRCPCAATVRDDKGNIPRCGCSYDDHSSQAVRVDTTGECRSKKDGAEEEWFELSPHASVV